MYDERKREIRSTIKPASSKSLWSSIKIAKDEDMDPIPSKVHLNGVKYTGDAIPEAFAEFFKTKVEGVVNDCTIDATESELLQNKVQGAIFVMKV